MIGKIQAGYFTIFNYINLSIFFMNSYIMKELQGKRWLRRVEAGISLYTIKNKFRIRNYNDRIFK